MKGIYANETKIVNKDFAYTTVVGQCKPKDVVCNSWRKYPDNWRSEQIFYRKQSLRAPDNFDVFDCQIYI